MGSKQSAFQPDLSGVRPYYSAVKHQRFGPSMQNNFLQDFNTQVVPIQLPGAIESQVLPVQAVYLLSEAGLYLLSEDNNRLTEE